MTQPVPRTCTTIAPDGQRKEGIALADLRNRPAYVLLGEPGAGKTTSFQQEADLTEGIAISARDFLTFAAKPEWQEPHAVLTAPIDGVSKAFWSEL